MVKSLNRRGIALLGTFALAASLLALETPASAARPKCFGKRATIVGTKGSDRIRGTKKADVIVSKGGQDLILARGGNDLICTGGGSDAVLAGPGNDKVNAGRGQDEVDGGGGNDLLRGGPGSDFLAGRGGNDRLEFGGGNFQFGFGGGGDDTIIGGPLTDFIAYFDAAGPVTVDLATGVATGRGNDTLQNIDGVLGGPFDDTLTGNAGTNFLFGEGGNDTIATGGNTGSTDSPDGAVNGLFDFVGGDTIFDDLPSGNDSFTGGAGLNVLSYEEAEGPVNVDLSTGTATGDGNDTVSDFQAVVGSEFDDTLTGSGADEGFEGRGGNDTIDGGGGTDFLVLFDFQNSLVNLMDGTGSGDAIWFSDVGVRAVPQQLALTGIEDVWGSFEEDDDITGDDGPNRLFGIGGNDSLSGLGGNDLLVAGTGTDTLDGGDGDDTCLFGENVSNCETTAVARTARRSYPAAFSSGRLFHALQGARLLMRAR
jgi:Ca2+-binding RTX toxin-like protein